MYMYQSISWLIRLTSTYDCSDVTNQVIHVPVKKNREVQGFSMVKTCTHLELKMECDEAI